MELLVGIPDRVPTLAHAHPVTPALIARAASVMSVIINLA